MLIIPSFIPLHHLFKETHLELQLLQLQLLLQLPNLLQLPSLLQVVPIQIHQLSLLLHLLISVLKSLWLQLNQESLPRDTTIGLIQIPGLVCKA